MGDVFSGTADAPLSVRFVVIANGWQGKDQFKAGIILTNHSSETINTGWTIYFNSLRKIQTSTVTGEVHLRHINGDFFAIMPGPDFSPLIPGNTLQVTFLADYWAIKISDAPSGFYIVFTDNKGHEMLPAISLPVIIEPFILPQQTTRNSNDKVEVPTLESRYYDSQKMMSAEPVSVIPIIPTPRYACQGEGSCSIPEIVTIGGCSQYTAESSYLCEILHRVFGLETTVTSSAPFIYLGDGNSPEGGYTLHLAADSIKIDASDNAGVFYGIQTLLQLFYAHKKQGGKVVLPVMSIADEPLFHYRGLHLDVARNFQTPATVRKLLDVMAHFKLNKFHFHLTDDEGWRIEIPGLPELTETGSRRGHDLKESKALYPSYGSGPDAGLPGSGYYTKEEFIGLLKYAKSLHIDVIPAVDMPGHARAAIRSMEARYDRLMTEGHAGQADQYRLTDPNDASSYTSVQMWTDNVMDIGLSSTYLFIEKVISEIVGMYSEAGASLTTFHIGGDEVPEGVWEQSPAVRSMAQANNVSLSRQALFAHFLGKVSLILKKYGLNMAGWEEVGLTHAEGNGISDPDLWPVPVIPYSWNTAWGSGGESMPYRLANAGYEVVICNAPALYFDFASDKAPDEEGFYWGGFCCLQDVWGFDPLDISGSAGTTSMGEAVSREKFYAGFPELDSLARNRIAGIQAQLWGETLTSADRLFYMLLPRMLALAERAWTPMPPDCRPCHLKTPIFNDHYAAFVQKAVGLLTLADHLVGHTPWRIPPCGIMQSDGFILINNVMPGLEYRYTTDGSDPVFSSFQYTGPFTAKTDSVRVRAFNPDGNHSSRTSVLTLNPYDKS